MGVHLVERYEREDANCNCDGNAKRIYFNKHNDAAEQQLSDQLVNLPPLAADIVSRVQPP